MRPTSHPKGFSLLEVLVVLAIVGLLLGATTLSFRQAESRRLQEEAERLSLVIAAVSDRAAMMNRRHRLSLDAQGYRVEEWVRGEWRALTDAPLQARDWGHGVLPERRMELISNGIGGVTPLEVQLQRSDARLTLRVSALGEVQFAHSP